MNFIQISLTTKCNYGCEYCPITQYRNTQPHWPISNSDLIPFMDRCLANGSVVAPDCIVELTGGEPALYVGIDEFIDYLVGNGFYVLIKTNGILEIPKHKHVLRVAAYHQLEHVPESFDVMLVIHDTLNFDEKVAYCINNNVPFEILGKDKTPWYSDEHLFEKCSFINPAGHNCSCQDDKPLEIVSPDNSVDYGRIPFQDHMKWRDCCHPCKAAADAWKFLKYFDDFAVPNIVHTITASTLADGSEITV